MNKKTHTYFTAVAGLLLFMLMISCMGGPPQRPQKVAVSCTRGILPEKAKTIVVISFDASSSETPVNGNDIASLFRALLPGLNYTVKPAALLGKEFDGQSIRLTPDIRKRILVKAKEKGIEGVVLGTAAVKQGNTIYTATLKSSTSGNVLWTMYGENVTPQRMVIELKQKMYPPRPGR